jgi:hypothetical protein
LVLELLRQRGIFSIGFVTVATARYSLYFFLLVLGLLRQRGVPKPIEKNTKNTTLSQQSQNQ